MDYETSNRMAAMLLNVVLFVIELYELIVGYMKHGSAYLASYTAVIGIAAAIVSAIFVISMYRTFAGISKLQEHDKPRKLQGKGSRNELKKEMNSVMSSHYERMKTVHLLRFIATVSLVTMFLGSLLVSLYWKKTFDSNDFFANGYLVTRFICPLISFVSFIAIEPGKLDGYKPIIFASIPTFLGALISLLASKGHVENPSLLIGAMQSADGLTKVMFVVAGTVLAALVGLFVRQKNSSSAE